MPPFIDQYVLLILVSTTQMSEMCMLCNAICIDLDLTLTYYAAALRSTGCLLPNEYVYCTNSMNRSRDKNLDALIGGFFSCVLQASLTLHKK